MHDRRTPDVSDKRVKCFKVSLRADNATKYQAKLQLTGLLYTQMYSWSKRVWDERAS